MMTYGSMYYSDEDFEKTFQEHYTGQITELYGGNRNTPIYILYNYSVPIKVVFEGEKSEKNDYLVELI